MDAESEEDLLALDSATVTKFSRTTVAAKNVHESLYYLTWTTNIGLANV